jgi:hypothetical protein
VVSVYVQYMCLFLSRSLKAASQPLTPEPDNLRYTAAYCVFGYPNATDVGSTPCSTSRACGNLQASVEHGIPNLGDTTAYSYCSAGASAAMDSANFDMCLPCLSAMGTTEYLANCKNRESKHQGCAC